MAVESREGEGVAADQKLSRWVEICVCPECYSSLEVAGERLRCQDAGHEFAVQGGIPILLPRGGDATTERYLSNYEAIATADLEKAFEGNRGARHQKLVEFIGSVRGKRVLDIGSSDAAYLQRMDAGEKVALDIAVEYLARIPAESNVIAVCADAEHLPIRAGHFDVIVISDVLEHVLHPEAVAAHLSRICRPDTRLIVHVPWEEDLSQYRDVPYEFTHLRSFNSYNFGLLFKEFYERRSRGTYPLLIAPLPYRLYGVLPRILYSSMMFALQRTSAGSWFSRRWDAWVAELPRREGWLLLFYKPIFRQFELRLWRGTLRYRIARWLRSRLASRSR